MSSTWVPSPGALDVYASAEALEALEPLEHAEQAEAAGLRALAHQALGGEADPVILDAPVPSARKRATRVRRGDQPGLGQAAMVVWPPLLASLHSRMAPSPLLAMSTST